MQQGREKWLGLAILLFCCTAHAATAIQGSISQPLQVVLDDDYPPYSFRDDQHRLVGLREDLWNLWARYNHRPVVLLPTDWADAQTRIQAHKAQVIDTMFNTLSRQSTYVFASSYTRIPVRLYYDATVTGIQGVDELRGFKVGVKAGDACVEVLRRAGSSQLVAYPNYDAMVQALALHQLHLFCMDEPPAQYLLFKAGLMANVHFTDPISQGAMSYAVLRGQEHLLAEVEHGFARIPATEIRRVQDRWLGHHSFVEESGSYLKMISVALAIALAWVGLLILWSRSLRVRVAQRTHDLVNALDELQLAHDAADEARENLLAVIDAIPDLMFELDGEGQFISYRTQNHALSTYFLPERFLGRKLDELVPAQVAQTVKNCLQDAHRQGFSHGQQISLTLDGRVFWFELSIGRKRTVNEQQDRYIVLARDISERRHLAEELARHRNHLEELVQGKTRLLAQANVRLTQLSRIQRALSRSSQALVRAIQEDAYQYDVCRIVVEECGHRMSWVGFVRDDAEGSVRPQAWAGDGTDYLNDLRITRSEGPFGMGPAGRAMRSGKPVILTEIDKDLDFSPWRATALQHGFYSSIAVPFSLEDGQQGVLSIYAGQPYAFSSEEIDLLQELVADFAYGIGVLRLRERHNQTMLQLERRAEQETSARQLQQSLAAQMQLMLDTMDSTILVWGADECLSFWNKKTQRLFPKTYPYMYKGIRRQEFLSILKANGEQWDQTRPWNLWVSPSHEVFHTHEGRILEFTRLLASDDSHLIMITDVTEINKMRETMERNERLASLGRMVAGHSHELNTPVGVALTASTKLLDSVHHMQSEVDSGQVRRSHLLQFMQDSQEASQLIESNLRRAISLIASFKQVAVDQTSEQRRTFDLHIMLQELVMTLQPMLKPQGHVLEVDVPEGILMDSYPGPLQQIVTNLVSNAVMHAFDGRNHGIMKLDVSMLDEDRVQLRFQDNGVGIPANHLQRIFDPFFTTRMGQGGTGLGLNIVHNLVTNLFGGTINVYSVLGQGTEFVLVLPIVAQENQTSVAGEETNDTSQGES